MNVIIVQAQNTTNKVEKDIILFEKFNSSTVIESTIEKLLKLENYKVVVLYSKGNEEITELNVIKNSNVELFLHEEDGYFEAFRKIVYKYNPDYVVRVNACNCLIDKSIIETAISNMSKNNLDYMFFENYPIGITPNEIISHKVFAIKNEEKYENLSVNNIFMHLKNGEYDIHIGSIKAEEQFAKFKGVDLSVQFLNKEYIERIYERDDYNFFRNENEENINKMRSKIYQFINKYNNMVQNYNDGKVFVVVLMPWTDGSLDVAELSIIIAYLLNIKKNVNIKLIVDDTVFGVEKSNEKKIQELRSITKDCSKHMKVYMLSDYFSKLESSQTDMQEIEIITEWTTISFNKGECLDKEADEYKNKIFTQLAKNDTCIRNFIKKEKKDCMFIPGGMYGNTALWYKECKKNNVRVVTYDSDFDSLMICNNDVASQQRDLITALNMLGGFDEAKLLKVIDKDINNKILGNDKDAYLRGYDKNINYLENYAVIYLNLNWDSAAIGIHNCFNNNIEWVEKTIKWLLDNTKLNIIIRQHPVEAIDIFCSKDDYPKLIKQKFNDNNRINFISAKEKINSYKLLDKAEFVIVTSSTIGLESVIKNKIVITESNSYYANAGVAYKANTLEEYYNLLEKASKKSIKVSKKQYSDAIKLYYLARCCIARTKLNPFTYFRNIDYLNDEIVDIILESIVSGNPLSYLIHLNLVNKGAFND